MRSFSIDEFCELHGLSRAYFYQMIAKGTAPKIFNIGRCRRISETANAAWIAACEAVPMDEDAASKASDRARKMVGARRDRQVEA